MLAVIVLAAGSSSRMGRPKPLLTYRGRTFLQTILDTTRALAIDCAIVAIAQDDNKSLYGIDLTKIITVRNTAPHSGPIGSIRAAVAELLNRPVDGAIVWPVDQPHIELRTLRTLVDAFAGSSRAIAIPRFQGRRGHPVIFRKPLFDELLRAPDSEGARAVVRADPSRVLEVDVDDPAVLEDIDTPEAYAALIRRGERQA